MTGNPEAEFDVEAYVKERIGNLLLYAQASERTLSAMKSMSRVIEDLVAMAEKDPDLAPEIKTAVESVREASAALQRLHTFASARLSVQMESG